MRAAEIVAALRGTWHGEYGTACCPAHEDRHPSLSIADGEGGRLLVRCFAGCDGRDVLAALRGRGLIDGCGPWREPEPAEVARRQAAEAAANARRARQALDLWREAQPIAGSLAERYLRTRAIAGPLPPSLRFHGSCWHMTARRFPALVAAVQLDRQVVAVHRIYLAEPGRKADVEPAKASLASTTGGSVRLSGGAGPFVVGEGIETSLSLLDDLADLSPRVWAALTTSGMAGLVLPEVPGELVVAPDPGTTGGNAAAALARRAHVAGWHVRIMTPPAGGADWNDLAMARAREVVAA